MQSYLWNPWPIFDELQHSLLDATSTPQWPQFDIEDSDEETVLIADLPGMTDADVEVTVSAPYLIVRGERKAKDGAYTRRGRFQGAFARQFRLGDDHDLDRISARLANGELTIRLEKIAKPEPRRVKLTSGLAAKVKSLLTSDKGKEDGAAG
jgi:HSP20 family protein